MLRLPLFLVLLSSCGVATKFNQKHDDEDAIPLEFPSDCSRETIEDSLRCIPGMTFKEVKVPDATLKNYRLFEIQFNQFTDHNNTHSEGFQQKIMLWHTDVTKPMVLQTSGYHIYSVNRSELAKMYDANQIQIEHRFFTQSRPFSSDWSKLTVEQSAKDFHRISQAFHSIYHKKWVGTGASKGGMTSVYHRYFFPNDLDATVAYVAPSSHSLNDDRYNKFLETVGGDEYADCRKKVNEFQRTLLKRKAEIMPLVEGSFKRIGSKELVYEYAVSESFFTFWQYKNPDSKEQGCASIPAPDAEPKTLAKALDAINPVDEGYGDEALELFGPYFYQAARELGAGAARLANISDLVTFPEKDFGLDHVVPEGSAPKYDGGLIGKVETWAKEQAPTTIFVYGAFDSWYAAAFPKPNEERDSHIFVQAKGNHGAKIGLLSGDDKKKATLLLNKWLATEPAEAFKVNAALVKEDSHGGVDREETTEDVQFRMRR